MAFSGSIEDYTTVEEIDYTKIYTKENPPKTMVEALRMAAQDIQKMLNAGYGYDWYTCTIKSNDTKCAACTAGAVCLRLMGPGGHSWYCLSPEWELVLNALSDTTFPSSECGNSTIGASSLWPGGFPSSDIEYKMADAAKDPDQAVADMLDLANRLESVE